MRHVAMAFVVLIAAGPAWAKEAAPAMDATVTEPGADPGAPLFVKAGTFGYGLVIAPKVGGGFGQPFGKFGSSVVAELEVGYLLPLPAPVNRRFELFLSGQYAGPESTGSTLTDPRLPEGGAASYTVTQRQAILTLGLLYRQPLPDPVRWLAPYVALGGRAYLMRTEVSGSAGKNPFGENRETSTSWGVYSALGADFFVGPGSVLLELQVGWAKTDRYILRDTNVGSMNLVVGYRFML